MPLCPIDTKKASCNLPLWPFQNEGLYDTVRTYLSRRLVSFCIKKNKKRLKLLIYFTERFKIICLLIFLSLCYNLVVRYELNKSNGTFCCVFLFRAMLIGNQYGDRKNNDLQNWFIWRHTKTLYWGWQPFESKYKFLVAVVLSVSKNWWGKLLVYTPICQVITGEVHFQCIHQSAKQLLYLAPCWWRYHYISTEHLWPSITNLP